MSFITLSLDGRKYAPDTDVILMIKSKLDEVFTEILVVVVLVADDPQVGHHLADVALDQNGLLIAE